jgi:hypothetical protein
MKLTGCVPPAVRLANDGAGPALAAERLITSAPGEIWLARPAA